MKSASFEVGQKLGGGLGNRFGVFVRPGVGPFKFVVAALCFFVGVKAFAEPLSLPGVHQSQQNIEIVLSDGIAQRVGVFRLGLERINNPVANDVEFVNPLIVSPELVAKPVTYEGSDQNHDEGFWVAIKNFLDAHDYLRSVVCILVYSIIYLPVLLVSMWFGQVMARRANFRDDKAKYIKFRRMLREKDLTDQRRQSLEWYAKHYFNEMKRSLRNGK